MRNIFFDLDGTLINSLKRMYILFSELVPNNNFSYEKYWDIKKNGADQREVLTRYFNYQDEEIKKVHKKWLLMIENEKLLEIDQPYNDANFILKNLCKNNNLYIVTARQSTEKVRKQIKKFDWDKYIIKILVTHQKDSKFNLITNNVKNIRSTDIMIGDTGEDVETGQKLGVKSYAVTTGNLNRKTLERYNPNAIYNNLMDFYNDNKTI